MIMSTALCKSAVLRMYTDVIEEVISGVRDLFIEDGVDEQVLQELKQTWEAKLLASKAVQGVEQHEERTTTVLRKDGIQPTPSVAANGSVQPVKQATVAPDSAAVKMIPIQITLPPQPGAEASGGRVLTIQVPATALQGNQLQKVLTGPVITATMNLPINIASSLLQQHVNAAFSSASQPPAFKPLMQSDGACDDPCSSSSVAGAGPIAGPSGIKRGLPKPTMKRRPKKQTKGKVSIVFQVDGPADTSDDDDDASDDDNDDDDIDDDRDEEDQEMEDEGGEEEPLNSEDDVTDEDPAELFDTENIVVCQYDKIIRNRNKWKFYLKDGIMNLNGQDYVFQKANGDAEW